MKLEWEGRTWDLDASDLDMVQTKAVRAHMGGASIKAWLEALTDLEGLHFEDAFQALYWLMLLQNGEEAPPIAQVNFKVFHFANAFLDAIAAEKKAKAEAAEPDPTSPLRPASEPSPEPGSTSRTSTTSPEVSQDG